MSPNPRPNQNVGAIVVGAGSGSAIVLAVMFFLLGQPMLGWAAVALIPIFLALGFLLPKVLVGSAEAEGSAQEGGSIR